MSVWPAWEVQDHESAVSWFGVRVDFPDGGQVEVLAVVADGCVAIEDVRAQPPLSLGDLAALADWIEEPLLGACGSVTGSPCETAGDRAPRDWPRGIEGWRLVADEYRAAQQEGVDPVRAVMCATGRSRRRSLKLIAEARDAGFLAPRHARL